MFEHIITVHSPHSPKEGKEAVLDLYTWKRTSLSGTQTPRSLTGVSEGAVKISVRSIHSLGSLTLNTKVQIKRIYI